jgi:hypothetical protein
MLGMHGHFGVLSTILVLLVTRERADAGGTFRGASHMDARTCWASKMESSVHGHICNGPWCDLSNETEKTSSLVCCKGVVSNTHIILSTLEHQSQVAC